MENVHTNPEKIKNFLLKYQVLLSALISFLIPLILYILTLERKLVGGDTTWYALYLPEMRVMVPTGYPTFSILGKLFSLIPFGDLAYRLNLISAIFGACTILFLFLATNKLIKNAFISLAGSLTFAFLYSYWTVANRLEFDTINSFFITLILYSAFSYTEEKTRKNLYFFSASLGLSLTNHPIAFFIMPAFILYIILVNPHIFKSIKAVLLSILFFLLPLSLYAWLPIRSLQGYGPVTSLKSFLYYITGRNITGKVHGGSFEGKNIETFLKVTRDFFLAIYNNYGILLLVVAIIGLIYLFKKNWKFALSSILMIVLNLGIIGLYLGYSPPNYSLNAILIISIYLSAGFLFISDKMINFFKKRKNKSTRQLTDDSGNYKKANFGKIFAVSFLAIIFLAVPVYLGISNYEKADLSEPLEIYKFWNEIFDYAEDYSVIYVSSSSSNIGEFINTYERPEKNITFISNRDSRYSPENVKKDIADGKKIYLVGMEEELIAVFNVEKITGYTWGRMNEYIVFYNYTGEKKDLRITYNINKKEFKFGEKFQVEYKIINDNDQDIDITSIELNLSRNLSFSDIDKKGTVSIQPSLSGGKYMWVKTITVKAKDYINIIPIIQASTPGEAEIEFKITSQNYYFESEEIEIDIHN